MSFQGGGRSGSSDSRSVSWITDQCWPYSALTTRQDVHRPTAPNDYCCKFTAYCQCCRGRGRSGRGRGRKPLNNGNYFGAKGQEMGSNQEAAAGPPKISVLISFLCSCQAAFPTSLQVFHCGTGMEGMLTPLQAGRLFVHDTLCGTRSITDNSLAC